jgi:TetR/AcrR family transcriptional regulator, tetracycline repressor protein
MSQSSWYPVTARSPRPGGRRGRDLDRDTIAATGLAIMDRGGLEALTMRGLAQELGVSASKLYDYVRTKDEIITAIGELVSARLTIPAEGSWEQRLRQSFREQRLLLLRHPGAGYINLFQAVTGPSSLKVFDALLGALNEAGLHGAQAMAALRILNGFTIGFTVLGIAHASDRAEQYRRNITGADPATLPHVAAASAHLAEGDSDEAFELGLDMILESLQRRRPR